MAVPDVPSLVAGGESYRVEFKTDVNDEDLVATVVCLANGAGGWLLLGVDDDGTVVGARPRHGADTDGRRLAALIANRTSPAVTVDVGVVDVDAKSVVAIAVPPATGGVVSTSSGRYLRRAIDVAGRPQCLPMLPHETVARVSSVGVRDLSGLAIPELVLRDLDPAELRRFRSLAEAGGDSVLAELSDLDLLAALGLRTVDGRLTLGAVLLFGTPAALRAFAPTHETAFQVLGDLDTVEVNRIDRQPLVRSMLDMVDAVRPYNPEEEIEDGLFRTGLPLYAEVSVRELLANALVHRDFAVTGQVRLVIQGRSLSVSNPGGFPEGITIDNVLTAPPRARNPLIADAFKRAGLVERTGRGVNRVFRSQLALGRPQPDYSRSTHGWVEARLLGAPADRELAAFVAASARGGHPLNLQTLQVLYEVRQESRITTARAAELLQTSTDEARIVLNGLVERGLLEARGERRGRTYHLSAALYRRIGESAGYVRARGFEPIQQEQMVLTYVTEHGSITRGQAAELCQLSPDQASKLLRRLTAEGKLHMTGTRRHATYQLPDQPR